MALRLENFKTSISETILKRGHSYYRNNYIIDLSHDEGVWEAQVRGSELYDVQIEQQANGSLTWDCTCPYAETDLCKHVVAVLYAIEAELLRRPQIKTPSANKPSKKTMLREALEATPHDALVEMLMNWAAKDRTIADQILLRLGIKSEKPGDYVALVKTALRQARDRNYGYIDGRHAAHNLESLLEQAQNQISNKQPMTAVAICLAITEECLSAFQEIDDSDGDIGGTIQGAVDIIDDCVPVLSLTEKKTLFELCLEHGIKMPHSGWDWEWSFYSTAANLVSNIAEREQLFKALDSRPSQSNSWGQSYDEEVKARIKLSVIERLYDTEAADAFLNANSHLDGFRQTLIQKAIEKQQLPHAIKLTMQVSRALKTENCLALS